MQAAAEETVGTTIIASIALIHDALLLIANLQHFRRMPGLKVEDWLVEP